MTAQDVIDRARLLMGDQRGQRFEDADMLLELNAILRECSADLGWYRNTATVPVCDAKRIYDLPEDLITLKTIALDSEFIGTIILSRTYRDVAVTGVSDNNMVGAQYWGVPFARTLGAGSPSSPVYFKDTVNANQFVLEPAITAEDPQPSVAMGESTYWSA